jgi:hypothetical protein
MHLLAFVNIFIIFSSENKQGHKFFFKVILCVLVRSAPATFHTVDVDDFTFISLCKHNWFILTGDRVVCTVGLPGSSEAKSWFEHLFISVPLSIEEAGEPPNANVPRIARRNFQPGPANNPPRINGNKFHWFFN